MNTSASLCQALAVALLVCAQAHAANHTAAPAPAPQDLQVTQAWIRWLPANLPAGGYVTLANHGDQPLVLTGASSPDYGQVVLHRSVSQGGISKMVPVARLSIAAHSSVNFAALGYHLMLMQPRVPIVPGDRVPVTLTFAAGQSLSALFEVRKPDSSAASAAQGMPAMPGMPDMPGMPSH